MAVVPASLPPPAASDPQGEFRRLRRLLLVALVLGCAAPLALNLPDADLWGHVRYGQDWIAAGRLPLTATHAYTAEGHPWVNHENLAELALAASYEWFGVEGMLALKCLVGMAVLGLMASVARRYGVRPVVAWSFLLLVASNLQVFFLLRPQLLSFLWCALALGCLEKAFVGWGYRHTDFSQRRRSNDSPSVAWGWLAPLPVLVALWTNSHGGFLAGLAIIAVFLGGRAVELLARRGRAAWPTVLGLLGTVAACFAATIVNPYGLELHRWLAVSLVAPRPEITEWRSPSPSDPTFWPFVWLAATVAALAWLSERRRDPVKLVILALVALQAALHLRHIAFFALLSGFWMTTHAQSVADRLRVRAVAGLPQVTLGPWQRRLIVGALAVTIAAETLTLGSRLGSLPVPRDHYPVDALEWMAEHGVRGRLVSVFNWAQYALAALAPDVKLSFDGRYDTCYPQEAVDRHFDFLLADKQDRYRAPDAGPIVPSREVDETEPDYVLLDRRYEVPVAVMVEADPKVWALVYQDKIAQVWGRRSVVDDPESDRYVPEDRRFVSDHLSHSSVEWPALPRGKRSVGTAPTEVARRDGDQPSPDGA